MTPWLWSPARTAWALWFWQRAAKLRAWVKDLTDPPPVPAWLAVGAPAHAVQIGTVEVIGIHAGSFTADVLSASGKRWTVHIAALEPTSAAAMADFLHARRPRRARNPGKPSGRIYPFPPRPRAMPGAAHSAGGDNV